MNWKVGERGWVGSGIQSINEVNFPPDAPDNEDEDNVDNNREDKDNNYLPRCFSFKAKSVYKWIRVTSSKIQEKAKSFVTCLFATISFLHFSSLQAKIHQNQKYIQNQNTSSKM